jgi:hypothetical protein
VNGTRGELMEFLRSLLPHRYVAQGFTIPPSTEVEPALRHILVCATYRYICGAPHMQRNGNWEVRTVGGSLGRPGDRADRNPSHSLVLPCGAFSRPGRSISMPSRTDGREHDGTLARHGHGRSPLRSMTLDQRAR